MTSPPETSVSPFHDGQGFSKWSELDLLSSNLSENANQSSLATNLHGGVVSNTIGLADLIPSSDPNNVLMPFQARNANCSALAYSVNPTTSSLQHGEMSMQHGDCTVGKCNVVITSIETEAAEKRPIPNQMSVPVVKKQKQPRDTLPRTRHTRARTVIPLHGIRPYCHMTLEQATKELNTSVSVLKRNLKDHGFSRWSDFKRYLLSENANPSSVTTSLYSGGVSNTSGIPVSNPSNQHNPSMPVVIQAGNLNNLAAANSVNDTVCSSQPRETSMQQNQAYGGTQFGFSPQNQLARTFPPETSSVDAVGKSTLKPCQQNLGNISLPGKMVAAVAELVSAPETVSDTSLSTKRQRAVMPIRLEEIVPHYDKTRALAAKALGISQTKLVERLKYYRYGTWKEFKRAMTIKHKSGKATHSSFTTTPHGGDFSNTSGLPALHPSHQRKNSPSPVVHPAGNVNPSATAYSFNNTTTSLQNCETNHPGFFQPQSITSPPETSVSLSHYGHGFFQHPYLGSILSEKANQSFLTTDLHGGVVNYSGAACSVNDTVFSSQPHETPMQQNQAYGGTQFGLPPQNQSVRTFPPETSSVSIFCGGDFSNLVLNESNQHNSQMPVLEAANVNQSSAPSSSWPDESWLMQYVGTNDLLGFQPQNQSVTTYLPEATMQNVIMQDDWAAVQMLVSTTTFDPDDSFELDELWFINN